MKRLFALMLAAVLMAAVLAGCGGAPAAAPSAEKQPDVENPPATIRSSGWYEVQDYMLISNHVFNPDWLAVNLDFWNRLSDSQRTVLSEAAAEFQEKMWEAAENAEKEDLQFMKDNSDIEVYYPTDEFQQEMIDATSGMYDDFYQNMPEYKDVVEEMRAFSR